MAELVEAAEVVEGVAAEVIRTVDARVVSAGIIIGFATGLGVGWWIANRKLATHYEKIAEDEISQMRDHYRDKMAARRAEGRKPSLRDMRAVAEDAGYVTPEVPDPPNPEQRNIFENPDSSMMLEPKEADEGWDYEFEMAKRTSDRPYIIHEDEVGEKDWPVTNLVYYDGDDILAEALGDHIVPNRDEVVGIENMKRWGHGTRDPSSVFIRNEHLQIDIEMSRSSRTYAEDVHGITHSDVTYHRNPKRSRRDE